MNKPKKWPYPKSRKSLLLLRACLKKRATGPQLWRISLRRRYAQGEFILLHPDKEELLYIVVREPVRQIYSKLEEIVSDAPIKAKIAQALANHMTLFHQHYPHMAVYFHDYHHLMKNCKGYH